MSGVKRYAPKLTRGPWSAEDRFVGMRANAKGKYVLHTDYAAVKDERDELARAVAAWGPHHCVCPKFRSTMTGQERLPHLPGCPVALAEEILKEDGK